LLIKMATSGPELVADEYLKFIATFKNRETFLGNWDDRFDATRTKCFEVEFGIRGKDGKLYLFNLSLYYIEALWNVGDRVRPRYFLTLWPSENFSGVQVDEEILLNEQKFGYNGALIKKGPYGQRGLEFTKWEVSDDYDLVANKKCRVELRIKIYANMCQNVTSSGDQGKERKLKFLDHTCGTFKIVGQDQVVGTTSMKKFLKFINGKAGRKEYYVDKDLVIKESSALKSMSSANGKGSTKIVLHDTNTQTLEAFLIFCYTGFLPMAAINENLAKFVNDYNVENLKSLLDKYVSMSLTARNAENWTKWAQKLKLKNTALRIWLLKRGSKDVWTKLCKDDQKFSSFIGLVIGTTTEQDLFPAYGKFGDLDFSENVMIH